MGDVSYKKNCHLESCLKPFTSTARNSKYCSEECLAASRLVHRSRGKRRRAYQKDAPNRRAQSMSRAQAREFAINQLVLTICQGCAKPMKVGEIETHHRDGDPFHNNLQNFALLCKKCHAQADVEWRKAKADGQPIPECRKWMLVAQGEAIEIVPFNEAAVPDLFPTPPEPVLVNMVHDAVIVDPTKMVPGAPDPYLEGILNGMEEDDPTHVDGETIAEVRETGTFKIPTSIEVNNLEGWSKIINPK